MEVLSSCCQFSFLLLQLLMNYMHATTLLRVLPASKLWANDQANVNKVFIDLSCCLNLLFLKMTEHYFFKMTELSSFHMWLLYNMGCFMGFTVLELNNVLLELL